MIVPQDAYRCPVCRAYFPDIAAFSAHANECEERHSPDASDLVGRILVRDDRTKQIVIPTGCTGGLAFCRSFTLEEFGDETDICYREFASEPFYVRNGCYRVADRETAIKLMDSMLASLRESFMQVLEGVEE